MCGLVVTTTTNRSPESSAGWCFISFRPRNETFASAGAYTSTRIILYVCVHVRISLVVSGVRSSSRRRHRWVLGFGFTMPWNIVDEMYVRTDATVITGIIIIILYNNILTLPKPTR